MPVERIDDLEGLKLHFQPKSVGKKVAAWYQGAKRDLPWRTRWFQSQDPYVVWISEIMLQQTVIKAVIPVYHRFLDRFPNFTSLAQADEQEVRLAVRGLGYYRRFGLLHKAAQELNSQPSFSWPRTFKEWKSLPGIGDYTAAAISSICFNQSVPVVDGNVERVFCRLLDIRLPPNLPMLKKKFFAFGSLMIPEGSPGDFNQGIMELGQTICTKQNPLCHHCPLQSRCLAKRHNSQELAPQKKDSVVYEQVSMRLVIPIKGRKIGLCKRPVNAKFLKDTWGFPTLLADKKNRYRWDGDLSLEIPDLSSSLGVIKHSITKHKIASVIAPSYHLKSRKLRWFDRDEIEEQLVSNLDRKALKIIYAEVNKHPTSSTPP